MLVAYRVKADFFRIRNRNYIKGEERGGLPTECKGVEGALCTLIRHHLNQVYYEGDLGGYGYMGRQRM